MNSRQIKLRKIMKGANARKKIREGALTLGRSSGRSFAESLYCLSLIVDASKHRRHKIRK